MTTLQNSDLKNKSPEKYKVVIDWLLNTYTNNFENINQGGLSAVNDHRVLTPSTKQDFLDGIDRGIERKISEKFGDCKNKAAQDIPEFLDNIKINSDGYLSYAIITLQNSDLKNKSPENYKVVIDWLLNKYTISFEKIDQSGLNKSLNHDDILPETRKDILDRIDQGIKRKIREKIEGCKNISAGDIPDFLENIEINSDGYLSYAIITLQNSDLKNKSPEKYDLTIDCLLKMYTKNFTAINDNDLNKVLTHTDILPETRKDILDRIDRGKKDLPTAEAM